MFEDQKQTDVLIKIHWYSSDYMSASCWGTANELELRHSAWIKSSHEMWKNQS
jgi:hypothetical protein